MLKINKLSYFKNLIYKFCMEGEKKLSKNALKRLKKQQEKEAKKKQKEQQN